MKYTRLLILLLCCMFSLQIAAQTTAKKPVTTAKKPATTAKKPATTAKKPATTAKKPATTAKKPATTAKKPATTAKKPATTAKKSTTTNKTVKKKPVAVATKKTSTPKPITSSGTTKCAELTKIAQIQCCLREKGYDPGETDNTLNAKTRQALARFQKDRYLPEGDLSIETMRALGVSK